MPTSCSKKHNATREEAVRQMKSMYNRGRNRRNRRDRDRMSSLKMGDRHAQESNRLTVYYCSDCDAWHVGHVMANKKRRDAAKRRDRVARKQRRNRER